MVIENDMSTSTALHESILPVSLQDINKDSLKRYFLNAWNLNDILFGTIKSEAAFYLAPDPLRNPLIFYHGHTAAFYMNKLLLAGLLKEGLNPHFEDILAKGVDPDLPENLNVLEVWPSVSEVNEYRETVKSIVLSIIDDMDDGLEIDSYSPYWALFMGIEHDRIHFETSSVLIRQLDVKYLSKPEEWEYAPMNIFQPTETWIKSEGGLVHLGKEESDDWFGWDNEYGSKSLSVSPFEATQNLITNGEYLEFYEQGYHDKSNWSEEGWQWKIRTATKHPKFWISTENGFEYRAQFDILSMPLDWPVEVNAYEAQAYCNWKGDGARLLTEPEFNLISQMDDRTEPIYEASLNVNFRFGSPTPVGYCDDPNSDFNDLYGNVWDWLGNQFEPLDDFKTHPYYEDFSAPYMDTDHLMMEGGSWITTGTGTSKYYRLWFRPYFYQHAGFRLARTL